MAVVGLLAVDLPSKLSLTIFRFRDALRFEVWVGCRLGGGCCSAGACFEVYPKLSILFYDRRVTGSSARVYPATCPRVTGRVGLTWHVVVEKKEVSYSI